VHQPYERKPKLGRRAVEATSNDGTKALQIVISRRGPLG
jgi:hypothetical protein